MLILVLAGTFLAYGVRYNKDHSPSAQANAIKEAKEWIKKQPSRSCIKISVQAKHDTSGAVSNFSPCLIPPGWHEIVE